MVSGQWKFVDCGRHGAGFTQGGGCLRRFFEYCRLMEHRVMPKYDAAEHWAKIEVPHLDKQAAAERLAGRYPVDKFSAARMELDPKNILSNHILDTLLPRPDAQEAGAAASSKKA
jgi:L-galactono-1,4-lactone dehydrogenase